MRVEFDVNGSYVVRFPLQRATAQILKLGEAFLRKEDQRAAGARTIYTEDIRGLVARGTQSVAQKSSSEGQRTQSSEDLKQLEVHARKLAAQIQSLLKATFMDTPAKATEWGFEVKQIGHRSGTILLPQGRDELVKTLTAYIATEEGRPAAERFKTPDLAEVKTVCDRLRQSMEARADSQAQRESGTAQANAVADELLDLLQAALVQIIVKQYGRKVTPDLQSWGFEVTARTAKQPAAPENSGTA